MMDEQYREAADFQNNENVSVGAEAPAPAPASTPVKVRKHTPQKNVDKFWKKVCRSSMYSKICQVDKP